MQPSDQSAFPRRMWLEDACHCLEQLAVADPPLLPPAASDLTAGQLRSLRVTLLGTDDCLSERDVRKVRRQLLHVLPLLYFSAGCRCLQQDRVRCKPIGNMSVFCLSYQNTLRGTPSRLFLQRLWCSD